MPPVSPASLVDLEALVAELCRRLDALETTEAGDSLAVRLARAHAAGIADQLDTLAARAAAPDAGNSLQAAEWVSPGDARRAHP